MASALSKLRVSFQNFCYQVWQLVADYIPDNLVVQMMVFVTQNVAHGLHLPPRNSWIFFQLFLGQMPCSFGNYFNRSLDCQLFNFATAELL